MLDYNDNNMEHKNVADDLGLLLGGIDKGNITRNSPNAYYMGIEVEAACPGTARLAGEYYLKKDSIDQNPKKGLGKNSRSANRVVVKVAVSGRPVEGQAWLWRHDGRVEALGGGFFKRAQMMRGI